MQEDAYAISGRAVTPTICPPNTPTLMLGVEKPPFALCFLSNSRQCGVCRESVPPEGFAMAWLGTRVVVVLSGGNSPSVPKRVYEEAVPASDRCSSGIQEFMAE